MNQLKKPLSLLASIAVLTCASSYVCLQAAPPDPGQSGLHALIRISCGGDATGDYSADTLSDSGTPYAVTSPIDVSASNAAPQDVYQHERYGDDFAYGIPAPIPPVGKSYTVRLHFAELYDGGANQRLQDVLVNGRIVLSKFDIYAETGAKFKAIVKDIPNIQPKDGIIQIEFKTEAGGSDANAAVNGIEILADGFAPVYKPLAPKHYPFEDSSLPIATRVDNLVSLMTLREKVSQMNASATAIPRLGIPNYEWWNEGLHGVGRAGIATVFPQAIGMAAAWDPTLHYQVASAISDEARAKYNDAIAHGKHAQYYGLTYWSPNINIFRDPRWGRGQETYGEDPYLTGRLAVAFITGMQGNDPKYLKVVATAKHFAVHSGPEALRHTINVEPSGYDLVDTYLPAFEAAVKEGHVSSVMGAYSSLNGFPDCASPFLLQQTLRDGWGFKGYVVSDCGAITDIYAQHHFADDAAEGSADAVKAGCDLACDGAYGALVDAVKRNLLPESDIDQAVKRLFTARMELGMFDPPSKVKYDSIPISDNDSPAHRALALKMAQESIVLLRNDGNMLPLGKALTSVAVIGPNADNGSVLLGNYNGDTSHGVTVLEGIKTKLGPEANVNYVQGCGMNGSNKDGFPAALALAQKSDVVIAVLGLDGGQENEGNDRQSLNLPGVQEDLLEALAATGKPVVLVLLNGSALAVNWASTHVPGIVDAWYPGEEGGTAVADVLFGDYNPAGRLPVTFYHSVDDLPDFTDYAMKARTYRYFTGTPLYQFGYGLSYSKFQYTGLKAPQTVMPDQGSVTVKATVQNIGSRAGDEVAELYLRPAPDSSSRQISDDQPMPRLVLAGFQRIPLTSGQSKVVSFTLTRKQLLLVNAQGSRSLNPGTWQVYVGGSQPDLSASARTQAANHNGVSAIITVK